MATNEIHDQLIVSVACTHPAAPTSGAPVRYGKLTGVAVTDEGEGGNIAAEATVDFTEKVWDLVVDDNGITTPGTGTAIAPGAPIYYHDVATGSPATNLNNTPASADALFGVAMEAVTTNGTATIKVMHKGAAV